MTAIALMRLKLAVPDGAAALRGRLLAEEALRCAGEEAGRRLVLIRQMRLGVLPAGRGAPPQAAWTARTTTVLRAQAAAAVHALTPGAGSAGAVWFGSVAEARAALALLLVRGAWPGTWFWQLAVPEWNGGGWTTAASALLRALAAPPGGAPELARVIMAAVASGDGPAMLAPVDDHLARALLPEGVVAPVTQRRSPEISSVPMLQDAQRTDDMAAVRLAVARVIAALAPTARAALVPMLRSLPPDSPRRLLLAMVAVLASNSTVIVIPRLLATVADEIARAILSARGDDSPIDLPYARHAHADRRTSRTTPPADAPARRNDSVAVADAATEAAAATTLSQTSMASALVVSAERRSHAAGLFLVIRPLALLGLGAWLDRHPLHAADQFAWRLLYGIATRLRIPEDDALWAILDDACGESSGTEDVGARDAWRIGLDRWLRRRARITLVQTVRRPGWLLADPTQIVARFRVDDADIRLRRLAIDVDPDWVPWLGRSVAFLYRDAPADAVP
jgi:hypothetical protein